MKIASQRVLLISLATFVISCSAAALWLFYQLSNTPAGANAVTQRGLTADSHITGPFPPTFTPTSIPTPTPTSTPSPTPTPIPTVRSTPPPVVTPPPTPTPRPRPNPGGLPPHVLTGYWQNFVDGAIPLRLSDINAYYTLVVVAFADADPNTPGGVTFTLNAGLSSALGGYTVDQFTSDIATLHARGKKVILSVGGGQGTVDVSDATSATNFATSVYGLMRTYGFDGVDIDMENTIDVANMTSALQRLSTKVGSRLIITLSPQTVDMQSTSDSYFQLALNIQNILTQVNMQYYNSGTMFGCDQRVYADGSEDFLTALACIQLQGGLDPSQVGLGVAGSPAAASNGYLAPATVNQALGCLASQQTCGTFIPPSTWSLGSVTVWSINVDASHGYPFANTIGPYLKTLP